jgi:hypothetical protein
MIRRLLVLSVALAAVWAAPAHASTWCGTPATEDRAPDLFGGPRFHVVYAIPADGTDRLGELANAIETDVEDIDVWWRGQDPTRAPRFDLFPFPCGAQADITTARLPDTSAQMPTAVEDYTRISNDLRGTGLLQAYRSLLVYYDGPVTEPFCGIGGGNDLDGLAIVFVNACGRTKSEWTAAHEIITAMGGVADGAPHRCPGRADTCDSSFDVMWQYIPAAPLSDAILDPGRDDYYGHSGLWPDIQDSRFLKHLDAPAHLTVAITGAGLVESDVNGVTCSVTCGTDWDAGTLIYLTATPGNGLRFVRWSGACTGEEQCRLTLGAQNTVSALFAPAAFRLTVAVAGRGTVASKPRGIACKPRCKGSFESYSPVRLTARPAKGWRLKSWTGGCRGKRAACSVPMTAAATARAVFVRKTG